MWQDSWVLFVEVLNAEPEVKEGILTPWIVFWAIATVVSMAAMYVSLPPFLFLPYSAWALQGAEGASLRSSIP